MFDNDISPRYADMLAALGVNIVPLRKEMPADTKDADFFGKLKADYHVDVFISGNTRQRTNQIEAALLRASGVTSLYLHAFLEKVEVLATGRMAGQALADDRRLLQCSRARHLCRHPTARETGPLQALSRSTIVVAVTGG